MNYKEFTELISNQYTVIAVLSDKNDCTVLKLRHNASRKNLILRKNGNTVMAYDIIKNFRHQNLPEVYDTLILDDAQVVIEEFIDGISVAEVLETGRYTYNGAKEIIQGVCLALNTLHSYGVVHRDIKPENIMITNQGTVKLIDLNASRKTLPHKTRDTVILGTIGYASPEQMGIAQCDTRTDIYALGVLLNVMLTGTHPSKQLASGKAGRIISRCTHIDPNSRYATVEKLLQAL